MEARGWRLDRTAARYDAGVIDARQVEAAVRAFVAEHVPALALDPTSNLQPPTSVASPTDPEAGDARSPAAATRVILAASGGADSTAMVAILVEAGVVPAAAATVAHFDHRLRGDGAAMRDRYAVEALCTRYGLPLRTGAWEAPRPGEAAAREARYRFLAELAAAEGAGIVVTGHTEDDQLETIVMQTMRGAGPAGAAGMAPERAWPHPGAPGAAGPRLARPLLATPRTATRAYCAARGLAFADDETNEDQRPMRNRVRRMMAEAQAETPEARALILQGAQTARAARATLEAAAARAVPVAFDDGERTACIDRDAMRRFPPELRAYAWRPAIVCLLGDAAGFARVHYATMAAAADARTGAAFGLPRGLVLTVDAGELVLSVGPPGAPAIDPSAEHRLPFEGVIGAWRVAITPGGESDAAEAGIWLPTGGVLRGRRPGDRITLPGGRHRKLQDAYIDAKVPRRLRDAAPVLAAGADVRWTPLLRLARVRREGDAPWCVQARAAGARPG